jgi:hypothetical protein
MDIERQDTGFGKEIMTAYQLEVQVYLINLS